MSHVTTVDIQITDMQALAAACARLGLELVAGQTKYRWYGWHVGDYPIPAGFEKEDLGKCLHAIRVPGSDTAYEIGVVERRDGKAGLTLIYDFYGNNGRAMERLSGDKCKSVVQMYAVEAAKRQAKKQGYRVRERTLQDGSIQLVAQA